MDDLTLPYSKKSDRVYKSYLLSTKKPASYLISDCEKREMAGFPKTAPALTITVNIAVPYLVGSVSRGTPLTVVPITGGTVRSEPGFEPAIEAKFKGTGNDYMHTDPTGKHMRLDSHVVIEWVTSRDDVTVC